MNAPAISDDEERNRYYVLVEPEHTGELISFLRQHLDGFSVDIGGIVVDYRKDIDVFNVPKTFSKDVLAGVLAEFYAHL